MRTHRNVVLSAFCILIFYASLISAGHHGPDSRTRLSHFGRADAVLGDPDAASLGGSGSELKKRYNNARFSFYDVGKGACGGTNKNSDYIVALNTQQYSGGAHCYKTIDISYNGKTTQAQVMDECPGCPANALDLSRGLFDFFASEDEGVVYGQWSFR